MKEDSTKNNFFDDLKWIFFTSRPIVWTVALVYLVGFIHAFGVGNLASVSPVFWLQLFTFTIPGGFLFYGINDWFDKQTDLKNERKQKSIWFGTIAKDNPKLLIQVSIICFVFVIGVAIATLNIYNILLYLFLVALGFAYSVPPIKLKNIPFADSIVNALGYIVIPYHLGYTFDGVFRLNYLVFIVSIAAIAFHLGGAYLDMEQDKADGQMTIAIFLGKKLSFLVCFSLFLLTAILINVNWYRYFIALVLITIIPVFFSNNSRVRFISTLMVLVYVTSFSIWKVWEFFM